MSEQHERTPLDQLRARARSGARLGMRSLHANHQEPHRLDPRRPDLDARLYSQNRTIRARAIFERERVGTDATGRLERARFELWEANGDLEAGTLHAGELAIIAQLRRVVAHLYALLARAARAIRALFSDLASTDATTDVNAAQRSTDAESPPDSPPLPPLLAALIIAPGAPNAPRHSLAARAA